MRLIAYFFSFRPSANISSSLSGASANGETKVKTSSAGVGGGTKEVDASFESTVTCYGTHYIDTPKKYLQLQWILVTIYFSIFKI